MEGTNKRMSRAANDDSFIRAAFVDGVGDFDLTLPQWGLAFSTHGVHNMINPY